MEHLDIEAPLDTCGERTCETGKGQTPQGHDMGCKQYFTREKHVIKQESQVLSTRGIALPPFVTSLRC